MDVKGGGVLNARNMLGIHDTIPAIQLTTMSVSVNCLFYGALAEIYMSEQFIICVSLLVC